MKSLLKYSIAFSIFLFTSCTSLANPNTKGTEPNSSSLLLMFIILLIGFFIGALFIYVYSKSKIYSILSNEKHKYFDSLKDNNQKYLFKYIGLVRELKISKDEKKIERDEFLEEKNNLKNELKKLKLKDSKNDAIALSYQSESPYSDLNEISKPILLKIEDNSNLPNEIYFTIPEKDGTFKTTNGKNIGGDDSFYKIVIGNDKQKGKISFISGALDLRALDNIDYYLNPVCEIENIVDRMQAKKIKMINPGIVQLSGDTWKIDVNNKVKIRLI